MALVLADGYCDTTGFGNAGACEHDDKGSFDNVHFPTRSTWAAAARHCADRCLACHRCVYISVSIQWNDCSWFSECSLQRLHHDIPGHKSMRVRNASRESDAAVQHPGQRDAELLRASVRSLPPIDSKSCWVSTCSANDRNRSLLAVGMAPIAQSWAVSAEASGVYGHIWRTVDSFFQCVVLDALISPVPAVQRTLLIPARMAHPDTHQVMPLFRELVTLFSGVASRMSVVRSAAVPPCPAPWERDGHRQCCHNASTRSALHKAHHGQALHFVELKPHPPSSLGVHVRAMRHVVWANLGVSAIEPDTVLFVSNEGSSNGRRIENEAMVAAAVRTALARIRPHWRFRYQRLESLSYANELRLFRRTTLMIGLFGSALHVRCQCHLDD